MADAKISALTAATSVDGTEETPIVQSATTKKSTLQTILDWILARSNTFTNSIVISVSSSSDALRITQTGSGNALVVEDSTNPDATPFIVDSAGRVGAGAVPTTSNGIFFAPPLTGNTTYYGMRFGGNIGTDVTNDFVGLRTLFGTAASGTSLTSLSCFRTDQATFNTAVTNQYGFHASTGLVGATTNYGFYAANIGGASASTGKTNYGFYSNVATASGGGTAYSFYSAGTADNWFSGSVRIGGSGGLGYTTGSGGAQTQGTSRTTGVTLDKTNGAITLVSAAGSTTWQTFTVTNNTVAATDTIIVNQKSGTDLYEIHVTAVAAGSFNISFRTTGGTTTEQPVFNFAVIKAVAA